MANPGPPPNYGAPPPAGFVGGPPPQNYQGYPPPAGAAPGGYPPPGGYAPQQPGGYAPQQPGYAAPHMVQPGIMQAPGQPGQPGQINYAPRPNAMPGCPPGLEYLAQVDQLLVHQQVEMFEAFTQWETQNKYQIKNSMGQQVYFAGEESDTCHRQCCGPQRGFVMHITDNMGQEVIRVNREFKCCGGHNCCAFSDCCASSVCVEAPAGTVVGYIKQQCSCLAPEYEVQDANQETVLGIEGPVCICQGPCCTFDQEFKVTTTDGQDVGKISKQWTGIVKEMYTDADNFGVSFPMDLDVKLKATMLGAVFLIDFMFFEQKQKNNN